MKKNIQTTMLALISFLILFILFGYVWHYRYPNLQSTSEVRDMVESQLQKNLDTFAQCLAEKKITMYGAAWCTHCQKEKAGFGSSFKYVPYVECPDNTQLCLDKGINGYPTWITADGVKYEGEQGVEKLASITGCSLTGENATSSTITATTSTTTQK